MKKNSFTLLEVILAITVLTLAVGGSFVLIFQTLASVSVVQSKLIASYLTQEGIEIIKNIRDTNLLKIQPWDQSLEGGDYEADYDDFSLTECPSPCDYDHDYNLHFLKISDQGFYNYDLGDDTKFKRKITILKALEEPDRLKVSVEVLWKERGKTHNIEAIEHLYNWYGYEEEEEEVCLDVSDNTQVPGCDGTCWACQGEVCGFADAGTYHIGCSACKICDGLGSCTQNAPDTNWGDNLYGCIGDDKRCESGSCEY